MIYKGWKITNSSSVPASMRWKAEKNGAVLYAANGPDIRKKIDNQEK